MQNYTGGNVTLKQLRAFIAVAQLGSFTRAAQRLSLSQPALTLTIRQLEETVGITFFDRTTRRVSLTADGIAFLPTAERLLADFDLAVDDLRSAAMGRRGRVNIAAIPSVATRILPGVVMEFHRHHPALIVHLRDDNSGSVCRRVRRNEVDIGFAGGEIDDPELEHVRVFRDRIGVVAHCDHPLFDRKGAIAWHDLRNHDLVGLGKETGLWPMLNEYAYNRAAIAAPRLDVSGSMALEAMLEAGLGVTVLPALAAPPESRPLLRFRPLERPKVMRDVFLVTRRGRSLARATQSMRSLILEHIVRLGKTSSLIESTI